MEMDLILAIGLMVVIGFFGGLVARKLKFPRITGYIIIGVLLSPSVLNIIPKGTVQNLDIITDIALGIIAYLVGGSLHIESLRKLEKSIAWITPFQSLGAWFFVTFSIAFLCPFILTIPEATFYQTYFPIAFVIGAVSCATAPAATMAIIHEYKAKGPLTTTLLAVVALDDAIAIGAFSIALGISKPLVSGIGSVSLIQMLGIPLLQLAEAIAIGIIFAFALVYLSRLIRIRELLLVLIFGMIMLCIGVANHLGISAILANMVIGFIVVNKAKRKEMFLVVEEIEDVIFAMFFVLAGLHFDLSVMKSAFLLALLIVLTRCFGKYMGTRVGATISHAPDTVKNYLGLALLPKAGVTVGLVLLAERAFPTFGAILVNAVIASVIINELIAPPLAKYAIFEAGESGT